MMAEELYQPSKSDMDFQKKIQKVLKGDEKPLINDLLERINKLEQRVEELEKKKYSFKKDLKSKEEKKIKESLWEQASKVMRDPEESPF